MDIESETDDSFYFRMLNYLKIEMTWFSEVNTKQCLMNVKLFIA